MSAFETSDEEAKRVEEFLRKTVSGVSGSRPTRGLVKFRRGAIEYVCKVSGIFARDQGSEIVLTGAQLVYGLTFMGGSLRRPLPDGDSGQERLPKD
jgi:hypothetical protein